ncbi:hypothetical protein [Flavobacterium sp. MMS24-S5]|uniref:hypothetical protein n=1 Tax=Flavobacterium sp. MMS24-S5 TaxID=3416605 RepID=UPI003D05FD78
MTKVKFSSPQPTGAIISQFFLALETCFNMREGEIVLVEKDGDVSLNNTQNEGLQIELKEYGNEDDLTDSHLNIWNTFKNWVDPKFNHSKYKYLILATTQDYGEKTLFTNWNTSNQNEKLNILIKIYEKAKERFEIAKEKDSDAKPSESLNLMNQVLKTSNLESILSKIIIDSNRTRRNGIADELKEKNLKFFSDENKQTVINTLLGFIMSEEEYNKGWEVSYDNFSKQLQDLSAQLNNESRIFPVNDIFKTIPENEKEKTSKYSFVKKIEEIEYNEVIPSSLNQYWFTINTINKEFSTRKQKMETLKQFQEDLITSHNSLYSKSSRSCTESDLINKSKDFYDEIIGAKSPNYDMFNNIPLIFKNGMYHLLADDYEEIVWKLKLSKK